MEVPKYGWKARLDHVFPQKRSQKVEVSFWQMIDMIPLTVRYIIYWISMFFKGQLPLMDYIHLVQDQNKSGAPIGGIGGGTIGRGFKGEFCRYQMTPGIYEYNTVDVNQFIVTIKNSDRNTVYQKVLSCQSKPTKKVLSAWAWDFPSTDAEYTALYPRAWTVFNIKEQDIKLICRQISPVIPHNYKDSCVPGAVFEWCVVNNSSEEKTVSITFTLKNGTGGKNDNKGSVTSTPFTETSGSTTVTGITMDQQISGFPCAYTLSALHSSKVKVSHCNYFDPKGNGAEIWDILSNNGELPSTSSPVTVDRKELACAICCQSTVGPNLSSCMNFSVCWDMPHFKFPLGKTIYTRYYTKFFGDDGKAGPKISLYALSNYMKWDSAIRDWQNGVLNDSELPDWYKSALFNELYYVADGGTVWVLVSDAEAAKLKDGDPRKEYGRFAWLEGHEYRMYNTYDVHFYASFALAMLWPNLQLSLQYDFGDTVGKEDNSTVWFWYNGERNHRKFKNSIPHDVGNPAEDPFVKINAYPVHNVAQWRDLGTKFILQIYRDYILTKDKNYLEEMFPKALIIMRAYLKFDTDNDGLIENSGSPDQTYDTWIMTGTSAYCGGLWLAAVQVFIKMAAILDQVDTKREFSAILEKGKESFDKKLWNGKYYSFDEHRNCVMADQLCGLWYLHSSNIEEEVFVKEHVHSALETVYKNNVLNYYNGTQGAVNGTQEDGQVDRESLQTEEVWTGVVYGLASLFIHEGMVEEGLKTAEGMYDTIYNKSGLGFASPEALHRLNSYRSVGYMRPLSVWSMQLAFQKRKTNSELTSRIQEL